MFESWYNPFVEPRVVGIYVLNRRFHIRVCPIRLAHLNNLDTAMKNITKTCLLMVLAAFLVSKPSYAQDDDQKAVHLFILSGQSNMAGMDPGRTFTPTVEKEFGKENVIVVKDAQGGQPIRRWYKDWKMDGVNDAKANGDLYDRLMKKVNAAIKGKEIGSVTFVWMQGERDARARWGSVYANSLKGILKQLSDDLSRDDINCVIGRLSDFDMDDKRYPEWTMIRKIQVEFAENTPRCAWIDTDDLNDGLNRAGKQIKNDLHYSVAGYDTLGKRFAQKAIDLIKN